MSEIAQGYFPDYKVQWDLHPIEEHSTEIETTKSGKEYRRGWFPDEGLLLFTASSQAFDIDERKEIAAFLRAHRGRLIPFYFFMPDLWKYDNFEVGDINGTTIVIPFKESSVDTAYVDGVSKSFTLNVGVGSGGEDQIEFSVTQTGTVTVDVEGRRRLLSRYNSDGIGWAYVESFVNHAVIPITIRQLREN